MSRTLVQLSRSPVWCRLVLVAFASMAGCAQEDPESGSGYPESYPEDWMFPELPEDGVFHRPEPDWYAPFCDSSLSFEGMNAALDALPFDWIELQRNACFGECPIDRVRFLRNGTACYQGLAFVEHEGLHRAGMTGFSFGMLCGMIEELKILEMSQAYLGAPVDSPSSIIRIQVAGEDTFREFVLSGPRPAGLVAFEAAVAYLTDQTDWYPDTEHDTWTDAVTNKRSM